MSIPPRTPLVQQVTDALRRAVSSGEWPVGARIPAEPALIERFAVSRGTLREAIKALSHAGMLEVRRGDGTYVRTRSEIEGAIGQAYQRHSDQDVMQVRFALDAQAARLAAGVASEAEAEVLRAILAERRRAWEAEDIEGWIDADWNFHLAVARASGNDLLVELYSSFGDVFHGAKLSQRLYRGFDGCRAAGHEELLEAIAAGDPDAADRSTVANLLYCLSFTEGG